MLQKYNTCVSRLPPPPASLPLPSSFPHPPSFVVVGRDISDSGALTGVFSQEKGDPSDMTVGLTYLMDQSRGRTQPGAQEAGDDQQRPLPLPSAPLVSLIRDLETNGG